MGHFIKVYFEITAYFRTIGNRMKNHFFCFIVVAIVCQVPAAGIGFADDHARLNQLKSMSLENLMDVTVYSAGHKNQLLADVASAMYVITQEDIRRSGARTLADLLRGVPGLHVANIDGHTWAVSARGFNGVFSNKLLVMIDGRSIYTPLYSGVYWDSQDTLLHDIDRIEIIRGPGATIWGANAVNGVINIITQAASKQAASYLSAGVGSTDKNSQEIRFGRTDDQWAYRIYGKRLERDNFDHYDEGNEEAYDNWHNRQAGFRIDWAPRSKVKATLQGDMYTVKARQLLTYDIVNLPLIYEDIRSRGGNLMATMEYEESSFSQWTLKSYIDRFLRKDGYFDQSRTTIDLRLHNQRELGNSHEIVWGGEFRYSTDHLTTSNEATFSIDPDSTSEELYSLFVQDEWRIAANSLKIISGSKVEHNDYTGYEVQPSLRLLWNPTATRSYWVAVSRAVRTPSRTENGLTATVNVPDQSISTPYGPMTVPTYVRLTPDKQGHSEDLIAYELGFRAQLTAEISLDTATFFNDYNEIRATSVDSYSYNDGILTVPAQFNYETEGYSYGVEISLIWQVIPDWRLNLSYSWLKLDLDQPDNMLDLFFENLKESTPEHQASLNSRIDLPFDLELDTTLYYFSHMYDTPAHLRTDIRLGWLPDDQWEISIKGENIFDSEYREYDPNFGVIASQVPRSWFAQVKYYF